MADWNLPTITSLYTDVISEIKARDEDSAKMFDGTTSSNIPTGAIKWNSTNNSFEKYNGTTWTTLTSQYSISVDQLNGQPASYYLNISNITAGTLPANHFNDNSHGNLSGGSLHALATTTTHGFMSSTDKQNLDNIQDPNTLLTKIKTVDGSNSGLDADTVDGKDIGTSGNTIPLLDGINTWSASQDFNVGDTDSVKISRNSTQYLEFIGTVNPSITHYSATNNAKILKLNITTDASDTAPTLGTIGFDITLRSNNLLELRETYAKVYQDFHCEGTYYYGSGKQMFQFSDGWLRLNPGNDFTSGVYAGTLPFRTDGTLQVGSNGSTFKVDGSTFTYNSNTVWHAGNHGNNSGLDADKVDGIEAYQFLRSDTADTANGHITFTERSDTTYSLAGSGTVNIDPANGHIQYATITGSTTITESLTDGQAVRLVLTNAGTNIVWPTGIVWLGGSAPSLQTSGTDEIDLIKIGSTLYGTVLGTASTSSLKINKVIDGHNIGMAIITTDGRVFVDQPTDTTLQFLSNANSSYELLFPEPVVIVDGSIGNGVNSTADRNASMVFLDSNGNIWTLGDNTWGQLGIGNNTTTLFPTKITPPSGTTIIKAIFNSLGGNDGAALFVLTDDGKLYSAGYNGNGQLGIGSTQNKNVLTEILQQGGLPWLDVVAFGSGYGSTLLKNANGWYACGNNAYGQLGVGDTIQKSTPTPVLNIDPNSTPYPNIGGVNGNSVYWVQPDGSVKACGYNGYGQLGVGDTALKNSPTTVLNVSNVVKIWSFASYSQTYFLTSSNQLYACGYNGHGQLGVNDQLNKSTPTLVGTFDVKHITRGELNSNASTIYMLTNSGEVYSAGYGGMGACFNGGNTHNLVFTQITPSVQDPSKIFAPEFIAAKGFYITYHQNLLWLSDSNGNIYAGGQGGAINSAYKRGVLGVPEYLATGNTLYAANFVNGTHAKNYRRGNVTYMGNLFDDVL